jgi:hypothetical protein
MNASRHFDDVLDAFLDEVHAELPDQVFDAVRGEIHGIRQRVPVIPWRFPFMSTPARLAIVAAAALAVAVAGLTLIRWPAGPGTSPSPSPTATPMLMQSNAALPPGRYVLRWSDAAAVDGGAIGPSVAITIPTDGWTSYERFAADKNHGSKAGISFVLWNVTDRYVDPCAAQQDIATPIPGPSVDELMTGLADQPGMAPSSPVDVVVDGYAGKSIDLKGTVDIGTCPNGFYPFNDKIVQANGELDRVYAVDVDGFRLTFFARIPAGTSPAEQGELQSVIDSIDVVP